MSNWNRHHFSNFTTYKKKYQQKAENVLTLQEKLTYNTFVRKIISLLEEAKDNMEESNLYFKTTNSYNEMSDEDLINTIKSGDKLALEFLIEKYKKVVNMKVSKFFMIGAERDDIVQEGLIGLFKAVKSYNSEKQNSFKTFASLCIERQLITAIKTQNRQKHLPLNSYLSLNTVAYEENEESNLLEIFDAHKIEDPLETITKQEYYKAVEKAIDNSLSDFEKQVLNRYIQGESYSQIAQKLDIPVKSVDNAIQRIRKKAIKNMGDSLS